MGQHQPHYRMLLLEVVLWASDSGTARQWASSRAGDDTAADMCGPEGNVHELVGRTRPVRGDRPNRSREEWHRSRPPQLDSTDSEYGAGRSRISYKVVVNVGYIEVQTVVIGREQELMWEGPSLGSGRKERYEGT
ncbi:uncharacterized protein B0H18DRAFT_330569 [Fomitopsis serialis]|uniref:uncharacterized protein n=1 Tax=Fomitopsis serialis TaxID=139415 RepID=UPI0020082DE9|nr:uncharacterized protein B0H18DRAFT_330569 [Neoantrodia serialis]KAH9926705.1 hypothetical protein B0H18DRAFT_330569 [Neoantrodia serialis]